MTHLRKCFTPQAFKGKVHAHCHTHFTLSSEKVQNLLSVNEVWMLYTDSQRNSLRI